MKSFPRPTKSKASEKLPLVDMVRTFSILAVIAHHVGGGSPPSSIEWLKKAWHAFAINGCYGVTIFFVISGFLITRMIDLSNRSLFRPSFKDFYARRAGRILPLLSISLLSGAILLATYQGPPSPAFEYCFKQSNASFHPLFWFSIVTFWFNWYRIFQWPGEIGSGLHWDLLWSLSIEEQFYIFYPWVLRKVKNFKNLVIFLSVFIFLGPVSRWLGYRIAEENYALIFTNSFAGFDQIALGILLYLTIKKWKALFTKNKVICLVLCLLGFWTTLWAYTQVVNEWSGIYGPTLIGSGVFFFLLGGLHLSFFNSKWVGFLAFPGKLSYGLYLLHVVILYFVGPFLDDVTVIKAYLIFVAIIIPICYLSYRFFEMPANLWIRRKIMS